MIGMTDATIWTVTLVALAGACGTAAAVLTWLEVVAAGRQVDGIINGDNSFAEVIATDEFGVNRLLINRATRALIQHFRGNWRVRLAAVLVLASIALGTAGGVLGAVK